MGVTLLSSNQRWGKALAGQMEERGLSVCCTDIDDQQWLQEQWLDVIVVDLEGAGEFFSGVYPSVKRIAPFAQIIALYSPEMDSTALRDSHGKADRYLQRSSPPDQIIFAVVTAISRKNFFEKRVTDIRSNVQTQPRDDRNPELRKT